MAIPWTKAYSVGVSAIDKDHRNLFELIDTLNRALKRKLGEEKIAKALTGLIAYTEGHFEREEILMARYAYPDIEKHKAQHRNLERLVHAIYNVFIRDPRSVDPKKLMVFLNHWLVDHIVKVDMQYARHIEKMRYADIALKAGAQGVDKNIANRKITVELQVPRGDERILQRCALLLRRDEDAANQIRMIADPSANMSDKEAKTLARSVLASRPDP